VQYSKEQYRTVQYRAYRPIVLRKVIRYVSY